jgi:hypothetical protein
MQIIRKTPARPSELITWVARVTNPPVMEAERSMSA